MHFLHVRFCSVSVWETELSLTCSVRFGQNGKTLLWLVTSLSPFLKKKNLDHFLKIMKWWEIPAMGPETESGNSEVSNCEIMQRSPIYLFSIQHLVV
jgi:hypothetical protein